MKRMIGLILAAGVAVAAAGTADARQGCGPGFHRGPYNGCRPNRGPGWGGPVIVGNYYHGRGYWDGRRYWQHRDRWHGGWRYR